jgi:TctA family transporter
MGLLSSLVLGLSTATSPANLLYCFAGVFLGTFTGVLPCVGPLAAVAMLLPVSFYRESTTALVMLAGLLWYRVRRIHCLDPAEHPGDSLIHCYLY